MNNKQPIFTEANQKNIWQKIDEIALVLMRFDRDCDPFLMYGEAAFSCSYFIAVLNWTTRSVMQKSLISIFKKSTISIKKFCI